MKILVAGATGKTGTRLVADLIKNGHSPVALARESSDTSQLPQGTELRAGDLTDLKSDVCEGCDAVIFAAGSGGSTGPDMTDKVDRDGAKRLIDIASSSGVQRFVMLSTVGAETPDPDSELAHYLQAKHEADEHLKASGIPYAILRPVRLTDEDGTGDVRFGDEVDVGATATRDDVAAVLAQAVDDPSWTGAVSLMQSV
ncbi:SDR family oxidoreductase [Sulfitobacter guttiformis]|uniref:Putative NAD(P)-binding protein n=1 Tax=Sulfitobacter guttiformis TaxID=74349 RepID=A0A420DU55_9RHOB|nr:SDR family oxidoreductase [Sulfitobacter guttiformis]KIN71323.1 NAD-dependent epimerase/dehydratase [Sulfitobacter guttiformis KCTC 32187]RKE97775.1 putative NAD(P)-binding protein [Sulfitobacter guttiformis]